MTGFGDGAATSGGWAVAVELAAVNRKQLEIAMALPRALHEVEAAARGLLGAETFRGRVQVAVRFRADEAAGGVVIDEQAVQRFDAMFRKISEIIGREVLPAAADFLRQPGLVADREALPGVPLARELVEAALAQALSGLVAMRMREGADLRADLLGRLAELAESLEFVAARADSAGHRLRESLLRRLQEAGLELDLNDERVLKEIALQADRCDVSEELTRLGSHLVRFREILGQAGPVGRTLDFLCQELFREINTIGAKAQDVEVTRRVVEMKTIAEQIREQVQNVE